MGIFMSQDVAVNLPFSVSLLIEEDMAPEAERGDLFPEKHDLCILVCNARRSSGLELNRVQVHQKMCKNRHGNHTVNGEWQNADHIQKGDQTRYAERDHSDGVKRWTTTSVPGGHTGLCNN